MGPPPQKFFFSKCSQSFIDWLFGSVRGFQMEFFPKHNFEKYLTAVFGYDAKMLIFLEMPKLRGVEMVVYMQVTRVVILFQL